MIGYFKEEETSRRLIAHIQASRSEDRMPLPHRPDIETLPDLIAFQAADRPDLDALVSEGRRWSYAALQRGIWRCAWVLSQSGITAGERVLLMAPTCDSFVIAYFSLIYLGAIPVPISPDLLEVEVIAHARDSQARLLLADASISDSVRETFVRACQGQVVRLDPRRQQLSRHHELGNDAPIHYFDIPFDEPPAAHAWDPDAIATILYTAGNGGTTRGVCLSHRNLLANARAITEVLPFDRHPTTAIALPLHHGHALTSQLLATLLVGGTAQLFRGLAFAFPVLQEMQREAIESFTGVPNTFHQLSRLDDLAELDLSSVRYVCSQGAGMTSADVAAIRRVFPHAAIFNHYGLTEAGSRVTSISEHDPRFFEGTVGKPLPGVKLRVVVNGEPAAPGEVGELQIQSPAVMRGYWVAPTATSIAWEGDWLRTGELARLDEEGYLYLAGRRDDVLFSGGEPIDPSEIEHVLQRYPAIREAAVVGFDDPLFGERIVAWVVPTASSFDPKEAARHCGMHLARFKCPHEIRTIDRLPKTHHGTIARAKLRELSGPTPSGRREG